MGRKKKRNQEAGLIHHVAGRLGCSDRELFVRAYRQWYGHSPGQAELECCLDLFACRGEIPFWVRGFVRNYLGRPTRRRGFCHRRDLPKRAIEGLLLIAALELLSYLSI